MFFPRDWPGDVNGLNCTKSGSIQDFEPTLHDNNHTTSYSELNRKPTLGARQVVRPHISPYNTVYVYNTGL